MRVLTDMQVRNWLNGSNPSNRKKEDSVSFDETGLFFGHQEASCIRLDYPPTLNRLPFFARSVATLGNAEDHFRGALMWITKWGVWNALDEGIGYRLVESLNRASGQPSSFEIGQGHAFRADELEESIAMLMQPMIFGWDAYYLAEWAYGRDEFFVRISHDSYVDIVTRTKEAHEQAFQQLHEMDFSPKHGPEFSILPAG